MTRLYITRHGQTEWNAERRIQGWKGADLTELGKKQAEWLRKRLKTIDFTMVYSSPLQRTLETARILLKDRDIPLLTEEGLKEMNMGEWEGKKFEALKTEHPEKFSCFWENPEEFDPLSGESFYEVQDRVLQSVHKIIEAHPHDPILLVSHGCATKIMLTHFEGKSLKNLWDPPRIKETSLSIVEIKNGTSNILLYGDTTHYQDV